jgi:tetratricopeptide (TPR) repeat protein
MNRGTRGALNFLCRIGVASAACLLALLAGAASQASDEPAGATSEQHIARLIDQLGDSQFAVRQRAQQDLVKLGFDAFDALVEAENSDDPEVAMQAQYLVRRIRAQWTRDTDPRPIRQIFEDYEILSDDRRLERIKRLAALDGDEGLPWLCRLVRFEKSSALSKQAALAIMEDEPSDEAAWNRRSETIHKELARARRPAARWLDIYLQARSDPAGALDKWSQLADAERRTLEQHPQETHGQIVQALLRRKIDLLDRLGRADQTGEVMRQMVLCERGDSASLTELLDWLVGRKAWDVVDLVAERFSASFEVDAVLMYTLCEARLAQGDRQRAEETAARALAINGDSQQEHALLAERLGNGGLPTWADREWRQVITVGPAGTQFDIFARDFLANTLHDRGLDGEAGELIRQLFDEAEKDPAVMQRVRTSQQQDANVNLLRSNMTFYFACQAAAEGDAARQRELLEKALEQDDTNVEVLIGLYRLTANEPEKRSEVVELVKNTVEQCRTRIEESPEHPTFYNQIAWLVANTEGDLDEAIELSQKSIELARESGDAPRRLGGLLDTLAHCHFANKDYKGAVKIQEEAAQLDPHTQSIRRALDRFREALAEQSNGGK